MSKGHIRKVFPGANTSRGFFSFFDYLIPEDAQRIFVIKGGPGVGKSTFMRRIAESIVELGFDVEYHCCAADPNSLDGITIPAFNIGMLDGTAPQVAVTTGEQEKEWRGAARLSRKCIVFSLLPGCRATSSTTDGATLGKVLLRQGDHPPDHVAADGTVEPRRNVAEITLVVRDPELRGDLLFELLQCLSGLRDDMHV